jgi:hypothetical protein
MTTNKQSESQGREYDRTGMHFEVSEYLLNNTSVYKSLELPPRLSKFLVTLLEVRSNQQESVVTSAELLPHLKEKGLPTSRQTIDRYSRTLQDIGVFEGTYRMFGSPVQIKRRLWRLRSPEEAQKSVEARIFSKSKRSKNNLSRSDKIRESNTQYLQSLENATPRAENFFFGFLDRCMPQSPWDHVENNFMRTALSFKSENIVIETSTQTNGDRLMCWNDKPVMRAILSQIIGLIEDRLAENGASYLALENKFPIDLVEIAKLMKQESPHNTKVQRRIYESVRAMASTRFDVKVDDAQHSEFMEFFNLNEENMTLKETMFRFISEIHVMDDMESREVPRHLVLNLGSHLWYRIQNNPKTKAIFRSHRIMLTKHVSGIMQVVYDYLRPIVFRTPAGKPDRTINRPLQHFARSLVPSMEYHLFKARFLKGLMECDKLRVVESWDESSDEPLEVKFSGYFITLFKLIDTDEDIKTSDNLIIQVVRDPYDHIIGDPEKKPAPVGSTAKSKQSGTSQISFF